MEQLDFTFFSYLVVREFNKAPLDLLSFILELLHLEDELIELLLEAFIGIVYHELFKAITIKALEAKDVQHSNVSLHLPPT